MKYRKKPVVIEAKLFDGKNVEEIMDWAHEGLPPEANSIVRRAGVGLTIHTLEGDHYATPGDFIIRGVKGEFYPCKPDIFATTYEPVTEGEAIPA